MRNGLAVINGREAAIRPHSFLVIQFPNSDLLAVGM